MPAQMRGRSDEQGWPNTRAEQPPRRQKLDIISNGKFLKPNVPFLLLRATQRMSSPYVHSSDMAQPSGSDLSKVESDIFQTISLADTVVTLVREPISLLYNNINKTKKLKQSLGAWQTEALDKNGQSRIPVLRLLEFEEHLMSTDGKVKYSTMAMAKAKAKAEEKRVSFGRKIRSFWASDQQLPSPQRSSLSPEFPNAGSACRNYFLYALGIHPGMGVASWRPSMDGYINT